LRIWVTCHHRSTWIWVLVLGAVSTCHKYYCCLFIYYFTNLIDYYITHFRYQFLFIKIFKTYNNIHVNTTKNKLKKGGKGWARGEVVGLCYCCCHSRYCCSHCSCCHCHHSHCHLPPAPAALVPAGGGGGVAAAQCLCLCSFTLVPPFVWAAPICAHWPLFVLTAIYSCSLLLICSCFHSFAGPCLSLLSCTGRLSYLLLLVSIHLLVPVLVWLSLMLIWFDLYLFSFHLGSFVLGWACLYSFVLWWVSFWTLQPLVYLYQIYG
jgi:hypothetical protein